jgi:hypothetical protein
MAQQRAANRADLRRLDLSPAKSGRRGREGISGGKSVAPLQHSLTNYGVLSQKLKKSAIAVVLIFPLRHKRKK